MNILLFQHHLVCLHRIFGIKRNEALESDKAHWDSIPQVDQEHDDFLNKYVYSGADMILGFVMGA